MPLCATLSYETQLLFFPLSNSQPNKSHSLDPLCVFISLFLLPIIALPISLSFFFFLCPSMYVSVHLFVCVCVSLSLTHTIFMPLCLTFFFCLTMSFLCLCIVSLCPLSVSLSLLSVFFVCSLCLSMSSLCISVFFLCILYQLLIAHIFSIHWPLQEFNEERIILPFSLGYEELDQVLFPYYNNCKYT